MTDLLGIGYSGLKAYSRALSTVGDNIANAQTPGYALLNLRTTYHFKQLTLNLGIDNVMNKLYFNPLGGVYIYATNFQYSTTNLPAVPAMGRSVFASFNLEF